MKTALATLIAVIIAFTNSLASGEAYSYGRDNPLIGVPKTYHVQKNESLIEVARKFNIGYNEIMDANPGLDPFVPGVDVLLRIPTSWLLPEAPAQDGIIINLSEMRLYYFLKEKGSNLVRTFPIGIGDEGTETPLGTFKITEKKVNPSWHVPPSIRKERPELPAVVPPGPENPLGTHAMRLSIGSVLVHGTNRPYAVGRKVTHGCIRLYPEDIPRLFDLVPNGTKVSIIRQPIKAGVKSGRVYLEVHRDDDIKNMDYLEEAVQLLMKKKLLKTVSTGKLYRAVKEKSGIPVEISN